MASPSGPLTLHVSDLTQATPFYLAALSPLGYGYISKIQHQTASATSYAVGLGPAGSSRVDIFLSESGRPGADRPQGAHVVFPATSTIAVRDFYAAALRAGGSPVARPDHLSTSNGMFASIVQDADGNQIEVSHSETPAVAASTTRDTAPPTEVASQAGGSIQQWCEGVAESTVGESVASSRSRKPPPTEAPSTSLKSAISTARSLASSQPVRAAMSAARAPSEASKRSTDISSVDVGGKAVVGTLIGAAAGAALAYSMVRSKQDSVEQQNAHERRLRSDDVRAEARAHFASLGSPQTMGKVEVVDRDSGYGSGSQHSGSPPMLRYHSVTYPQSSTAGSARGRSDSRKLLNYGVRTASPETYYYAAPPQSVSGASQSTVKPVRRSHSHASKRSESSHRPRSPRRLPGPPSPPSMPAAPASRPRRASLPSQAPPSLTRSYTEKNKPPSSYSRAMGGEAPRPQAPSLTRSATSYRSSKSARNVPLPPSEAPSASVARPPSSHRSDRTARQTPLPASESPSMTTARPPSTRRSSTSTARKVPLPTSEASTKLTARALSYQERLVRPSKTRSRLDDMDTVVPDDSISCVSDRDERREQASHTSRRSKPPRRASINA